MNMHHAAPTRSPRHLLRLRSSSHLLIFFVVTSLFLFIFFPLPSSSPFTRVKAQSTATITVNSIKIIQEFSEQRIFTRFTAFIVNHVNSDQVYSISITGGTILESTVLAISNERGIQRQIIATNESNIVKLFFTKNQLPVEEEVQVDVSFYRDIPPITHNYSVFSETWEFQTRVTIIKFIDVLPVTLSLNQEYLEPKPTSVYQQPQYSKLTWITYNNKTMNISMSLKQNNHGTFMPFTVTPQSILVINTPEGTMNTSFTIQNNYYRDLNITVYTDTPKYVQLSYSKLFVKINQSITFNITLLMPPQQTLSTIYFSSVLALTITMKSMIILKPTMTTTNTGLSLTQLFLVFTSIMIATIASFLLLKPPRTLKEWYFKLRKQPLPPQAQSSSPSIQSTSTPERALLRTTRFDENEKRVISFLLSEDNVVQQRIADNLQLSKATVSRAIAKLEQKGVIKREKIGMSNKIKLNHVQLTQILKKNDHEKP